MKVSIAAVSVCFFFAVACARHAAVESPSKTNAGRVAPPSPATQAAFDAALARFAEIDRNGEWTPARCHSVADSFRELSDGHRQQNRVGLPAASYNAGLAYERCGIDDLAEQSFRAALVAPTLDRARVRLALRRAVASQADAELVPELERAVARSSYQNVEALVALAAAQMERDDRRPNADGPNDVARAKKNLQRALAVDDRYLPAYNRLALYYLEVAGREASANARSRPSAGKLDLARLVVTQGLRRNDRYPPFHNTAGLVAVALGKTNEAVKSFARARELDPRFFEAHFNHGAVLLSFRAFEEAEAAFRAARALDPRDYDAVLGLALALRGQVSGHQMRPRLEEAQRLLTEARALAPARPETDFNEARLVEHFEGSSERAARRAELEKAIALYSTFIDKADGSPDYADAVTRARERRDDLKQMIDFMDQSP
jgi:tetratricopeptide (TPR) repeat protein